MGSWLHERFKKVSFYDKFVTVSLFSLEDVQFLSILLWFLIFTVFVSKQEEFIWMKKEVNHLFVQLAGITNSKNSETKEQRAGLSFHLMLCIAFIPLVGVTLI